MVLAKSKNAVGLGNSLMNDRFGKGKGQDMRRVAKGIRRVGPDGQEVDTCIPAERLKLIFLAVHHHSQRRGGLDENAQYYRARCSGRVS